MVLIFPEAESKALNQPVHSELDDQDAVYEGGDLRGQGIAAYGKVALQMIAKEGSKLWTVSCSHRF